MQTEIITPRLEAGGAALLLLPEFPARPGHVLVYSRTGKHSEASWDYVVAHTQPLPSDDPRARSLAEEWCNISTRCRATFVHTLPGDLT